MTDLAQRAEVRERVRNWLIAAMDAEGCPEPGYSPSNHADGLLADYDAEHRAAVLAELRGSAGLDFCRANEAGLKATGGYLAGALPPFVFAEAVQADLNAQLAAKEAAWREEHERLAQRVQELEGWRDDRMERALEAWGWTSQTCPAGMVGCYLPPGHDHQSNGPQQAKEAP